jgi:hypothetical protein
LLVLLLSLHLLVQAGSRELSLALATVAAHRLHAWLRPRGLLLLLLLLLLLVLELLLELLTLLLQQANAAFGLLATPLLKVHGSLEGATTHRGI